MSSPREDEELRLIMKRLRIPVPVALTPEELVLITGSLDRMGRQFHGRIKNAKGFTKRRLEQQAQDYFDLVAKIEEVRAKAMEGGYEK